MNYNAYGEGSEDCISSGDCQERNYVSLEETGVEGDPFIDEFPIIQVEEPEVEVNSFVWVYDDDQKFDLQWKVVEAYLRAQNVPIPTVFRFEVGGEAMDDRAGKCLLAIVNFDLPGAHDFAYGLYPQGVVNGQIIANCGEEDKRYYGDGVWVRENVHNDALLLAAAVASIIECPF